MISSTMVEHSGVNKVLEVWGYYSHGRRLNTHHHVPAHHPGELQVLEGLEPGFYNKIDQEIEHLVYVNVKSDWVCAGNPQKTGRAVEFINNCVAVIDNSQELQGGEECAG